MRRGYLDYVMSLESWSEREAGEEQDMMMNILVS